VGEDIVYQEALKEYNKIIKYNSFKKGDKILQVIDTHEFLERQNKKNAEKNKTKKDSPKKEKIRSYLKQEKAAIKPFRKVFFKKRESEPIAIRPDDKGAIKVFNDEYFKTIVQAAKTRIGSTSLKKVDSLMTHLSELRADPLAQFKAEDLIETLKRSIVVLQLKFKEQNGDS
jgi:hypothetical protein